MVAAEIKYTKTALRHEQVKLRQLKKYLPTLQLKKALLQAEVLAAEVELEQSLAESKLALEGTLRFAPLLADRRERDLLASLEVQDVQLDYENIAGVDIPIFISVEFALPSYFLFDTPVWFESALFKMKEMVIAREKVKVHDEKKRLLEKELREISMRVNLFEKRLIPQTESNMKRITIFLGDQQLAAIAQAKVAKAKIRR